MKIHCKAKSVPVLRAKYYFGHTGKEITNKEKREQERAKELEERNRWTIKRLREEYLANNNPRRVDADISRFNKHIGPALGDAVPNELVKLDITRFRRDLEKKGLKPGTVSRIMEVLRRIINFGVDEGLIEPVRYKVILPEVRNKKTEYLTDEQFVRLWEVLETYHDRQAANLMKLALLTGLRAGDLFGLKWEHIEFEQGFIDVVDPYAKRKDEIPMNAMIVVLLKNHPQTLPRQPLRLPRAERTKEKIHKETSKSYKEACGLT